MRKALTIFTCITLGSVALCALAAAGLLVETAILEHHGSAALAGITTKINSNLDALALELKDVHELTRDARFSISEVNRNVLDERKMYETTFPDLVGRVDAVLANIQTATGDLHPLLVESTARIHDLQPIEDSAAGAILASKTLIADPRIPDAIANLDAASTQFVIVSKQSVVIGANVADTTGSVKAIAADGQHYVHSVVYPKPLASAATWTLKVVHAIGGFF